MKHRSLSPQTLAAQALGETDPATGAVSRSAVSQHLKILKDAGLVTDPTRFRDWQKGVVDGHMDGPADGTQSPAIGARCVTTRRIGVAGDLGIHPDSSAGVLAGQ